MKRFLKYTVLFIWLTVFMYYYYEIFPRTILWLMISIPLAGISCLFIIKMFEKPTSNKQNPETQLKRSLFFSVFPNTQIRPVLL